MKIVDKKQFPFSNGGIFMRTTYVYEFMRQLGF
jgi:hypothetical protein